MASSRARPGLARRCPRARGPRQLVPCGCRSGPGPFRALAPPRSECPSVRGTRWHRGTGAWPRESSPARRCSTHSGHGLLRWRWGGGVDTTAPGKQRAPLWGWGEAGRVAGEEPRGRNRREGNINEIGCTPSSPGTHRLAALPAAPETAARCAAPGRSSREGPWGGAGRCRRVECAELRLAMPGLERRGRRAVGRGWRHRRAGPGGEGRAAVPPQHRQQLRAAGEHRPLGPRRRYRSAAPLLRPHSLGCPGRPLVAASGGSPGVAAHHVRAVPSPVICASAVLGGGRRRCPLHGGESVAAVSCAEVGGEACQSRSYVRIAGGFALGCVIRVPGSLCVCVCV